MTRWNDGYVADIPYTSNFYRELTPAWLHLTCLLVGQRPPVLSAPLRYAELGCGFGLTSAVVAACHPDAEVWGFDFNPAHVEAAGARAFGAGLAGLRYQERSFADLAAASDLPVFDVVALHGVFSWVSPENRRAVIAFIGRFLRPGGLVYVSYNVATGWASMAPLQALMRQAAKAGGLRSDEAAGAAARFVARMQAGGAAYMPANPAVEPRLKMLSALDARYVAHEYLNEHWQPLNSAEVIGELAEAKCAFIGSATLTDNIDAASAPPGMLPLLSEQRDVAMRETVRDFACAQGFRRDVYRRGLNGLPSAEHIERLDALRLAGLGRKPGEEVTFPSSLGEVTGRPEIYRPLLQALEEGDLSLAAARALPAFEGKPLSEIVQALTLLVAGGYAAPLLPDSGAGARGSAKRLNLEIVRTNRLGGDLAHLVAPAIGSAVTASLIETLVAGELLDGRAPDPAGLTSAVAAALARTARHVQADGVAITETARAEAAVRGAVESVLADRVPVLRRLGVLD